MHCLASSQRSLTSPRKGTTSFPSTKTERAVQGSPHNACIRLVSSWSKTIQSVLACGPRVLFLPTKQSVCPIYSHDNATWKSSTREIATQPVILWILLGGKLKWLPLNFRFNDVIIGASLSEPHSYVLTRTFAIGDIYIYIYINRASDRLALCPRRSKPKSRANPVLRLSLPLALIDNDFLSKGCLCKSPVFLFLHPLHRVFSCPLRHTRSGFFRQAFCLSLPFFHAQEIDDWGPKFRFRLWWPLID